MTKIEDDLLEAVLSPVDGPGGCGDPAQYTPAYDAIRRARQTESQDLPAGVWERPIRKTDWSALQRDCMALLNQSKDLQVTAWLVETLVQQYGLQGLTRGAELFLRMTTLFWGEIHPKLEERDALARVTPVNWLLREIVRWHTAGLLDADENESIDNPQRVQWWAALVDSLAHLDTFLTAQVPESAPSFGEVSKRMGDEHARSRPPVPNIPQESAIGLPQLTHGTILTRDMAYAQLHAIAEFLERVEPHSPVPTVLRGVASWQAANFEALLMRLPKDGPSLYELIRFFAPPPTTD